MVTIILLLRKGGTLFYDIHFTHYSVMPMLIMMTYNNAKACYHDVIVCKSLYDSVHCITAGIVQPMLLYSLCKCIPCTTVQLYILCYMHHDFANVRLCCMHVQLGHVEPVTVLSRY